MKIILSYFSKEVKKTKTAAQNLKQNKLSITSIGNAALGTLAAEATQEILKKSCKKCITSKCF